MNRSTQRVNSKLQLQRDYEYRLFEATIHHANGLFRDAVDYSARSRLRSGQVKCYYPTIDHFFLFRDMSRALGQERLEKGPEPKAVTANDNGANAVWLIELIKRPRIKRLHAF